MRRRRTLAVGLGLVGFVAACSEGIFFPSQGPDGFTIGSGAEAVLVGAGDIAQCGSRATEATAKLLDAIPGIIFTAGDNAYPSGREIDFRNCYEPTWGRHKGRTRPAPGNHEYETAGAGPYFSYFGEHAGPAGLGYYRYKAGDWQVYSLNSNVPMDAGSAQVQWLRSELAANPSTCTLAYWHHPRFSSGPHGDTAAARNLWAVLYDAGAEIVVSGHDHLYERFAPQDPDGRLDPQYGIREFVAGTGGAEASTTAGVHANSDVRWMSYGVLVLTLRARSYSWRFVTETGAVADVGDGICHSQF